ncbi:MAG: NUDIX domain-containing protein [Bacilli bacterium]
MEKRDLYNENRELTGNYIYKDDEIPENSYILIVVAFIENDENKFLIQKRSIEKGGEWAFTGGHPKSGESSTEGIHTEVKEELGIEINNAVCFKKAKGKDTFCDLYYIKQNIDINTIELQKEEVEKVCFASVAEIESLFNKGIFKKGHYMMFKDCLNYIDNINLKP